VIGISLLMMACAQRCKTTLEQFDALELEAAKYGLVAAGAVRIVPYDNGDLRRMRARQAEAVEVLREEFLATPPTASTAEVSQSISKLMLELTFLYKQGPSANDANKPSDEVKTLLKDIEASLDSLAKTAGADQVAANRVDSARLRLGQLKFLDEHIGNLQVLESSSPDRYYDRMLVSVQLTAMVRPEEAAGVLAQLDLYPSGADQWCHDSAKWFATPDKKSWPKIVGGLKDIYGQSVVDRLADPPTTPPTPLDSVALAHAYLATHGLMPRIVNVEPIDEGELVRSANVTADLTGASVGIGIKGEVGLDYGSSKSDVNGVKRERVLNYSLAFAAGSNRAGWLFFPQSGDSGARQMRPTERRVQMVVDVPKGLRDLALHVHKEFLDDSLLPIKGASFSEQMESLNKARLLLSEVEDDYPEEARSRRNGAIGADDYATATNWRLAKSRVRNALHQSWSEELIAAIPDGDESHEWVAEVENEERPVAIHGRVVDEMGATDAWVVIHRGIITAVATSSSQLPHNARRIEHDGYIFPGLIDTHNHPHYNFVPAWRPGRTFQNRYEWQDDAAYKEKVTAVYEKLPEEELYDGLKYGEVRAVIGGTTTLQGTFDPPEGMVLVRNLELPYDAVGTATALAKLQPDTIARWREGLEDGSLRRVFIHLAEGKRSDSKSKAEFEALKQLGLLRAGVVVIHGTALGETEFKQMAAAGVPLVWSPTSNLNLYGETSDVAAAMRAGVTVALAPDWSITGSDNLLEEMKVAADYLAKPENGFGVSEAEAAKIVYRMSVTDAARVAGLDSFLGDIRPGFAADLVLAPEMDTDPWLSLLQTTPDRIRATYVDGNAVYGDLDYLRKQCGYVDAAIEECEVEGTTKGVILKGDSRRVPRADQSLADVRSAFERHGITPAPLTEN